jgi:addiction module RelB/DinJ family antitoxin
MTPMKTLINIKADKAVKEGAQKLAEELGLSLSAVINAYLKHFVRSREVYFSAVPHMTPELEMLLGQVETDLNETRNLSHSLRTTAEVHAHLDAL